MARMAAILWALVVLAVGPVAGLVGDRRLRTRLPSRGIVYSSNAVNLIVLGLVTALVDATQGGTGLALIPGRIAVPALIFWSAALCLLCIGVSRAVFGLRSSLHWPPKASVLAILPQSRTERVVFAGLCLLTGLVEEFLFRGFLLLRLATWLGSAPLALLLVSTSFALMHGIQDRLAISAALAQGLLLGSAVLTVHSLLPSIMAHGAVDLFAGFYLLSHFPPAAPEHMTGAA